MVARRAFLKWVAVVPAGVVGVRALAACDDDAARGDVAPDATTEVVPETEVALETVAEVEPDSAPDVDTSPDPDTAPDTSPDVAPETTADAEVDTTPKVCTATTPDALGPYYIAGAPAVVDLAGGEPGKAIAISGLVLDTRCEPIANAQVEIWQADDDGDYHDDKLRATIACNAAGAYAFTSIMPGRYLQATGLRPAHLHYRVSAPGYRTIVTQIYFQGDPYLQPNDSCTTCGSDDPARILALTPIASVLTSTMDVTLRTA